MKSRRLKSLKTDYIFIKLFFYYTLVAVSNCQGWIYLEEDNKFCKTGFGHTGRCIPIEECSTLQPLKNPLDSYCGIKNGVINVCCKSSTFTAKLNKMYVAKKNEFNIPYALPSEINQKNHRNFYLLPTNCGYINTNVYKIFNGQAAFLNEFPWMALLYYKTRAKSKFNCGATIINENYVLTAAHCVKDRKVLGVRVGEYDIKRKLDCGEQVDGTLTCTPGTQDLLIQKAIIHPEFNISLMVNDIALIRVSKKINLNHVNARPVCLPQGDLMDSVLETVTVTGWGFTETGQKANILQKATFNVIPLKECKEIYKNEQVTITYRQVCAGGKMQDSCRGDSGGPLHKESFYNGATRYIQHGIVSSGYRNCGTEGYPGIYTRVAYYMDWILDNLEP